MESGLRGGVVIGVLRSWFVRLGGLFGKEQRDRELAAELEAHLRMHIEENLRAGLEAGEARRQALIQLGGVEQTKENYRDRRGLPWLDASAQDVRFGLRMLRKNPGFAAVAVLTIALGIGANTAIFSVVNTVLLSPLHSPDAGRIVVFLDTSAAGYSNSFASEAKFNLWREQTSAFEDVSGYKYSVMNLTAVDQPEQVQAEQVSANFFHLFGFPLAEGRTFSADELVPNGREVAILSNGLWRRQFGGDPHILGRTISLGGSPYEVVGIMAPVQTESAEPIDVWVPLQIDQNSTDQVHYGNFTVAGRLKFGITLDMAKAQLQLAADEFRRKYPGGIGNVGPKDGFSVQPMKDALVGDARLSLLILAGAVGLVLLIACANVASLLLVRASGRKREIAIRASLGAGRSRIIRQMLVESMLLSVTGGVLGLALGIAGIRALLAMNPGNIPRIGEHGSAVTLDWRVFVFTAVISLLTGILFGLLPAFQSSRVDFVTDLKASSGAGTSFRQNRVRSLLVVGEMGVAVVLLAGAGLLIRTFISLRSVNPGIDARDVLTVQMILSNPPIGSASALATFVRTGIQRLAQVPGVEASAAAGGLPLGPHSNLQFTIIGRPLQGRFHGRGDWFDVSPGYFDVLKIPILRGRAFTDRDENGTPSVVIINETMAREFWPHADPLRDSIVIAKGISSLLDDRPRQIVGIVGDVHNDALPIPPFPSMYVPMAQLSDRRAAAARSVAWIVRTSAEPYALSSAIQGELRQASGGMPLGSVHSMNDLVGQSISRQNFNMLVLTIFGCSALILAAIGIYGLLAYSVQQRTREIGIRIALGANPREVCNMVLREGSVLTLIGILLGVAAGLALTRLMTSLLYGVKPWDPVAFGAVVAVLGAVAIIAAYIPARRAMRVDPMVALRYE
jgi:putative ABC transport system permease protein